MPAPEEEGLRESLHLPEIPLHYSYAALSHKGRVSDGCHLASLTLCERDGLQEPRQYNL